jgi:hypothetical protein
MEYSDVSITPYLNFIWRERRSAELYPSSAFTLQMNIQVLHLLLVRASFLSGSFFIVPSQLQFTIPNRIFATYTLVLTSIFGARLFNFALFINVYKLKVSALLAIIMLTFFGATATG